MTPSQPSPTNLRDELREEIYNILDGMQVDYVTQTISLESKFANGVIKQEEYRARCSEEYERCMKESIAAITAAYAEAIRSAEPKRYEEGRLYNDAYNFAIDTFTANLQKAGLLPTNGSDEGGAE